jgi:hypothetical protein
MLVRREIWNEAFGFHVPFHSLVKRLQVVPSQRSVSPPPAGNLLLPPFKLPTNSADLFACLELRRGVAHPLFAV